MLSLFFIIVVIAVVVTLVCYYNLTLFLRIIADVSDQDIRGQTALHFAVKFGQVQCVKLLLESGITGNEGGREK